MVCDYCRAKPAVGFRRCVECYVYLARLSSSDNPGDREYAWRLVERAAANRRDLQRAA